MKKITFEDLPSTNTPIDSDNLNLLQNNIEEAIEEKQSLPIGGTTGQVLGKNSDADYDVSWINQTGGGSASYDAAPVGAMFDYPSLTPPIGYKICDGSELSRTEYSELFSVIGTTYGSGDGNTTFNLPNRLGRLSIGYKQDDEDFGTLGATGGSKTHTQTVDEMPSHKHNIGYIKSNQVPLTDAGVSGYNGNNSGTGTIATASTGSGQPMNIMNPYIVSCPIIKVSGTAVLTGNVVDSLSDDSATNAPSQKAVNDALKNVTYDLIIDGEPVSTGNIINGKPEYVKRISLNQFPNATSKTFSTGISNATWVRHFVYMNSSNYWHVLPYHSLSDVAAGVTATVTNDASTITINAGTDRSSLNGVAEVYFTYNS